jgi:hypothetical protein
MMSSVIEVSNDAATCIRDFNLIQLTGEQYVLGGVCWRPKNGSLNLAWRAAGCYESFYLSWKGGSFDYKHDAKECTAEECTGGKAEATVYKSAFTEVQWRSVV